MPETKTEVKCQHCGIKKDEKFVSLVGNMINPMTSEVLKKEYIFCDFCCLTAWLLDDLIKSPYSRIDEEWKPVLQQFHDYMLTI